MFEEGGAVATTATVRHTIRLKDETPVPQYRYSRDKKRIIAEQVERMLATNVIWPSHSSYNSPVVIVPKKNGEPRFCVDFRRPNDKTHDESSPLPPIHEALRDLGTASFSTLDLRNGYWQVELDEESKLLTAFTTPDGAAYEFQVMPFGLKGAPTAFQKLMVQKVLVGFIHEFAIAYLEDIIVFSDTPEEHQRHLRLVFERLSQHGLRLSLDKCKFASGSLDYLGHVVTSTGNQPQTAHVSAIANAEVPEGAQAGPRGRQLVTRLHPGVFRVTCPTDRPTDHKDAIQVDPGSFCRSRQSKKQHRNNCFFIDRTTDTRSCCRRTPAPLVEQRSYIRRSKSNVES